jgi:Uma2 family endonuclease
MVKLNSDLLTVEDFLQLPEFKPPLEYFGGRVVQKMSPNRRHSVIQISLGAHLLQFIKLENLGMIYSELRCSFGGDSYVPDLCFIARGRIPRDKKGELVSKIRFVPDFAIEILSPGQTVKEIITKLRFAVKHGLRLGWLIHPIKKQVYLVRPRRRTEILRLGGILSGEDVLPGFTLGIDVLFGWLEND